MKTFPTGKHNRIKSVNDDLRIVKSDMAQSIHGRKNGDARELRSLLNDTWQMWRTVKQRMRNGKDMESAYESLDTFYQALNRIGSIQDSSGLRQLISHVDEWLHGSNEKPLTQPEPILESEPESTRNEHTSIDQRGIKELMDNFDMTTERIGDVGYAVIFKDSLGIERIRLEHKFHKYSKGLYTFNSLEVA